MDERELELMICAAACEVVNQSRLVHGVYVVPASVMEILGGLVLGAEADSEEGLGEIGGGFEHEHGIEAPTLLRPLSENDLVDSLGEPVELDDDDDEDFDIDELARAMPIQSVKESRSLTPAEFIRGGKAVFTLTDEESGKHFTYRINVWRPSNYGTEKWFVNLGTGYQDAVKFCELNGMSQLLLGETKMGLLNPTGWKVSAEAPSRKLFEKFITALNKGMDRYDLDAAGIKFQHAGRCCVCSRELTHPESIEMGIGPECMGKAGME